MSYTRQTNQKQTKTSKCTYIGDGIRRRRSPDASDDRNWQVRAGQTRIALDNVVVSPRDNVAGKDAGQEAGRQVQALAVRVVGVKAGNVVKKGHGPEQDGQVDDANAPRRQAGVDVGRQGQVAAAKVRGRDEGRVAREIAVGRQVVDKLFDARGRAHGAVRHAEGMQGLVFKVFHNGPKAFGRIGRSGTMHIQNVLVGNDEGGGSGGRQGGQEGSSSTKHHSTVSISRRRAREVAKPSDEKDFVV